MSHLCELSLGYNEIGTKGARDLAVGLKVNIALRTLRQVDLVFGASLHFHVL